MCMILGPTSGLSYDAALCVIITVTNLPRLKQHVEFLGQGSQTDLPHWQPVHLVVKHTRRNCLHDRPWPSRSPSKTGIQGF